MGDKEPTVDSETETLLSEKGIRIDWDHLTDEQSLACRANHSPAKQQRCALVGAIEEMSDEGGVRVRGERDFAGHGCSPK
jgi:hypothetical protein